MFTPCSPRLLLVAALGALPLAGAVVRDARAALGDFRELAAEQDRTAAHTERAGRIRGAAAELTRALSSGNLTLNEGAYRLRKAADDCPGFFASVRANTPGPRTERELYARVLVGMVGRSLEGKTTRAAVLDRLEAEYQSLEEQPAWPAAS